MQKGNAVIGQSGGPTSVINSSLAGVIEAAVLYSNIGDIYGMQFGIEGLMQEWMYDLGKQPSTIIKGLRSTPSSALGSSRHKVTEEDFPLILEVLKKYSIRYFFMIGGNDTMDTINRVETYCRDKKYELTGIGIPKTVDNDLFGTDHTPGFASAARSNILNVMQAGILARDMQKVDRFVIYQTIGRDAGWLAAARNRAAPTRRLSDGFWARNKTTSVPVYSISFSSRPTLCSEPITRFSVSFATRVSCSLEGAPRKYCR